MGATVVSTCNLWPAGPAGNGVAVLPASAAAAGQVKLASFRIATAVALSPPALASAKSAGPPDPATEVVVDDAVLVLPQPPSNPAATTTATTVVPDLIADTT